MRVLFVYPNLYTQMGFNHGLANLSACLKARGHETRLVNLNENLPPVATPADVYALVREWEPGLVAFSCLSQQYREGLAVARFLRESARRDGVALPPIVVGGIHPTMVPLDVMRDGVWDHVGVGECEEALVELAESIERAERRDDVQNFLSWKGGVRPPFAGVAEADAGTRIDELVLHNPVRDFPALETLPMPDFELFDTQRILDNKHGWMGLLTSRGCPYRCTYCLNHKIVDRYRADLEKSASGIGFFRFRPPALVVEEMRSLVERYEGIGTFILDDDLFTQNVEHALEICKAYEESGIGLPLVVNAHVKRLDPRVAAALARAGCRILKLGIESGSRRVRYGVLQRPMSDDDILSTIAFAEGYGLHTSGFVMIGLPTETREERLETVDLLARSGIGRFRTSLFFPFPGTEGHRLAVEKGYVREEAMSSLTDFTNSSCLDFGDEENLFIEKLAACMPWFVNARMARYRDAPAADRYAPLVERVVAMDRVEWEAFRPGVRGIDAELSATAVAADELHYAIRYNAFMGVRSDFFLAEDGGIEWTTAAAKPVPDRLRDLALAAAADEVA